MTDNPMVVINKIVSSSWEVHSGGMCDMVARIDIDNLDIKTKKEMMRALINSI